MGLQWGEMGQNNLGDFWCFFLIRSCIFWGFWGLYYSKMANEGPRSYPNTFWMILGTSKFLSKSGPADLLIITKRLQRIQENYGIILDKYYFCQYGTQNKLKVCMSYVPCVSIFRFPDFVVIF